ncbi:hypothetical protein HYQ44_007362 [Verticillium longisporum]|nr:hypothetical protein HYQ44_007362 [Verticillium longisporum]
MFSRPDKESLDELLVAAALRIPVTGRVNVLQKNNTPTGEIGKQGGKRFLVGDNGAQADNVDPQLEVAGQRECERALAATGRPLVQVATTPGNATVGIPVPGSG